MRPARAPVTQVSAALCAWCLWRLACEIVASPDAAVCRSVARRPGAGITTEVPIRHGQIWLVSLLPLFFCISR